MSTNPLSTSTAELPPASVAPLSSRLFEDDAVNILVGITSMLLVLCILAVGARLLARRMSRVRLEADDFLCLVSLSFVIGLSIEQYLLALYGKSMRRAPSSNKVIAMKQLEFASQLTYTLLMTSVKLSILMLYRRIFSLQIRWFRIAWWANLVFAIVIGLVQLCLTVAGCSPHPMSHLEYHQPKSCNADYLSAAILGFMNAASDFLIYVLPIRMCWSLQLSRQRRLGIIAVFGLCLIPIAVSLARAFVLATDDISQGGGNALNFIIWSTTEATVALICACLPTMRKLFTGGVPQLANSYIVTSRLGARNRQANEPSLSKIELSPTVTTSRIPATQADEEASFPHQSSNLGKTPPGRFSLESSIREVDEEEVVIDDDSRCHEWTKAKAKATAKPQSRHSNYGKKPMKEDDDPRSRSEKGNGFLRL